MNCASRLLDEKSKGVESPSDVTFQKMCSMFPRKKDKYIELPVPEVTAAQLTHFKPAYVMKAIQSSQGDGGISHLDTKSFKRAILNKMFRKEATRIVNSITDIINNLSATGVKGETREPMRALRIIAVKKPGGGIRLRGISEIIRRIITKVVAWEIKEEVKQAT